MTKLKDTPKFDRPREKFLEKGADALSDSELLAILLGSGIKGTNVKILAQKILKKFGDKFLNVTVDELTQISGIGPAKALQIVSVLALAGRLYDKQNAPDNLILSAENAVSQVLELKEKKQEHLVCLYLNARNALLKKETVSIGTLDKSIIHPREIFAPAIEMRAAGVILVHNHPSGDPEPSEADKQVAKRIIEAGKLMGVNVIDFLIIAKRGTHSVLGELHDTKLADTEYVAEGMQASLFDLLVDANQPYFYAGNKNANMRSDNTTKNKNTAKTEAKNLKFMDFCAGIGAGRLGLEKNGLTCVGFSEIDKPAERTYRKFFGEEETNYGDLMKIDTDKLPDFDMMIAGFPCQTFSIIGERKGMEDKRGQVIYGLIKIMLAKRLKYFILENVKGLMNHNGGNSLKVILSELDKAGYKVFHKVLNSIDYGVPQMRERIYFVGIRKDLLSSHLEFYFPERQPRVKVADYLSSKKELEFDEKKESFNTFTKYLNNKYNRNQHDIKELLKRDFLVIDTRQSDVRLYENKVPTLRTGRQGILYVRNGKFRKLSGYESLLLQGFPKELAKKVDGTVEEIHLLKQTGNAMTVNVIEAVAREMFKTIKIL